MPLAKTVNCVDFVTVFTFYKKMSVVGVAEKIYEG